MDINGRRHLFPVLYSRALCGFALGNPSNQKATVADGFIIGTSNYFHRHCASSQKVWNGTIKVLQPLLPRNWTRRREWSQIWALRIFKREHTFHSRFISVFAEQLTSIWCGLCSHSCWLISRCLCQHLAAIALRQQWNVCVAVQHYSNPGSRGK